MPYGKLFVDLIHVFYLIYPLAVEVTVFLLFDSTQKGCLFYSNLNRDVTFFYSDLLADVALFCSSNLMYRSAFVLLFLVPASNFNNLKQPFQWYSIPQSV
jgi:hypothetical protein